MMLRILWLAAMAMLVFSVPSRAANVDANTQTFLTNTCEQNMFAISAGKWMVEHTTNTDVRNFAQHEIDDHSAMNNDLTELSTKVAFARPADMGPMKQEKLDKLSKMTGKDADKFYLASNVVLHEHAVKNFDMQSTSGQNADVSAFAVKYITSLREHLRAARDLDDKLSKTSEAIPVPMERPVNVSYEREGGMYQRVSVNYSTSPRIEDRGYERTALPIPGSYSEPVSYVQSSDCCDSGCAVKCSSCDRCTNCEYRTYIRE